MDQGSNKNHSPAYNFTPTVTKFCVMWEGLSLPHDTKFGNCRCKIVDSRSFHSWSLIHGLRWSGLIKVGPGDWSRQGITRHDIKLEKHCLWSMIIGFKLCNLSNKHQPNFRNHIQVQSYVHEKTLQSGAIVTQSNITRCWTQQYNGELWGVCCEYFGEILVS